jgi:hypothetical protein
MNIMKKGGKRMSCSAALGRTWQAVFSDAGLNMMRNDAEKGS